MRNVMGVLMVLAAAACGSKDNTSMVDPSSSVASGVGGAGGTEGTGGTGGGDEDASADVQDESIVPCGAKSCNRGEYCCDGTWGACSAVGSSCPANPCGLGADGAVVSDGAAE